MHLVKLISVFGCKLWILNGLICEKCGLENGWVEGDEKWLLKSLKVMNFIGFHEMGKWKKESNKTCKKSAVFCTARIQAEAYPLKRNSRLLERASFSLGGTLQETCPLKRNSGLLKRASFCLGGTLQETCPLERKSGSLKQASFCLRRMLPETCPLERALDELEWTSLRLRSLSDRTLWWLERIKFWMRSLEWTDLRSSRPDAVWFLNLNEEKERIEGIVRRKKTWSCQVA